MRGEGPLGEAGPGGRAGEEESGRRVRLEPTLEPPDPGWRSRGGAKRGGSSGGPPRSGFDGRKPRRRPKKREPSRGGGELPAGSAREEGGKGELEGWKGPRPEKRGLKGREKSTPGAAGPYGGGGPENPRQSRLRPAPRPSSAGKKAGRKAAGLEALSPARWGLRRAKSPGRLRGASLVGPW